MISTVKQEKVMFKDKNLLITGGTGSFGNALLDKLIHSDLKEIRIFSRDEKKQEDMRIKYKSSKLKFYIGDVRDYNSINQAMKNIDYVFHAAALKQVPSCEFFPMQAIKTNIIGAENTLQAACENNVKKMIVLSTDKAVYPINAMGLSKALMEKLMVAKSRIMSKGETIFSATRYGNVMASRGSVIPLFVSQIKNKQPITITEPNMTRFLMSLADSVELVLYCFENSQNGDIFVQKSPACTIKILAEALLKIFDARNQINYLGTRHGEKQYESLVSSEEMAKAINLEKYYQIPSDDRDLNYAKYFVEGESEIIKQQDYTSDNTTRLNLEQVIEKLLKLDYIQQELNA